MEERMQVDCDYGRYFVLQTSRTQPNRLVERVQVECDCPSLQDMIAVARIGGLGDQTSTKSMCVRWALVFITNKEEDAIVGCNYGCTFGGPSTCPFYRHGILG